MVRVAELEVVQYKVDDIGHATGRLIHNFAEYSGIVGTQTWEELAVDLWLLIRDQVGFNCSWRASGMDVEFSYFLDPRPLIREGNMAYVPPEPRVSFIEKPQNVSPSVRTHVGRVLESIAREMEDVYKLSVERDPLTLVFTNVGG